MTMNPADAPKQYDVVWEMNFSREKLQADIPNRLQELLDIATNVDAEPWRRSLIAKMILAVNRACADLRKTIDEEALPTAAWNARNLLELWIWLKYCAVCRDNAWRFHQDTLQDFQGLTDALSKLHALAKPPNDFEGPARQSLAEVAREQLGLTSLDGKYKHVGDAAKSLGLSDWFAAVNALLSKFAHPTAGLVIGIMHVTDSPRAWQAMMVTTGLYFAGQCVIAIEDIVKTIPAAQT